MVVRSAAQSLAAKETSFIFCVRHTCQHDLRCRYIPGNREHHRRLLMEHSKDIADAITTLIKLMVDHPEGVRVECVPITDGSSLRISVDAADIGKVIGKQGRTARSLRILVTAMGMASKQRISLDIQE